MVKFCTACGAALSEENKFCPACGAQVAPTPAENTASQNDPAEVDNTVVQGEEAPAETAEPDTSRTVTFKIPDVKAFINKIGADKVKKIGIIGGAAIAAIIVISIVLSIIFPSPKAVLKKGLDALVDGNAKQFVNVLPSFLYEMSEDMDKSDYIDLVEESMDDSYMEDLEYKIKKIEDVSSSDKRSLKKTFEYLEEANDDFDADDITDFKKAKVRFDDGDDSYNKEFVLIKYKGRWCLWYLGF